MTMIEKILRDRAWRGAKVRRGKQDGRDCYLVSHPSGAEAVVYKEPGDMDSHDWARMHRRRAAGRSPWVGRYQIEADEREARRMNAARPTHKRNRRSK